MIIYHLKAISIHNNFRLKTNKNKKKSIRGAICIRGYDNLKTLVNINILSISFITNGDFLT